MKHHLTAVSLILAVLFARLAASIRSAHAAPAALTITVNRPFDMPDVNPGDGVCEYAPGKGICTLRAAVQEANASPGAYTIRLQARTTYLLTPVGLMISPSTATWISPTI